MFKANDTCSTIALLLGLFCLIGVLACESSDDDDDAADDDVAQDDDDDAVDDDSTDDDDDDNEPPPDCEGDEQYANTPNIVRGPYLQHVTRTSIRIMWETDEPANTIVKWGPTDELGWSFCHWEKHTHHELDLVGLEQGSAYRYVVRSDGAQSATNSFATAPDSTEPVSFAALADSHVQPVIHSLVLDGVAEADPDLLLYAGDISGSGELVEFDEGFFGPGAELFANRPVYAVMGNHEKETPYFFELFSYPEPERWYAFSYGNTRFIGLDTYWLYFPGSEQYNWLEQELISAEQDPEIEWVVVFAHYPAFCEGWGNPGYDGELGVRLQLLPLLEEHNADLFINGHAHDYERGELRGLTHLIVGGAGGGLDTHQRDWPHIVVYEPQHHFVLVRVEGRSMHIQAISMDGEVLDDFVLEH